MSFLKIVYINFKNYLKLVKSPLFDSNFYLKKNHDVRTNNINPIKHFLSHGWKEGRRPSREFDLVGYLSHYPDVALSGINPLLHYIQSGSKEGRLFQFRTGNASYSGHSPFTKLLISIESEKTFLISSSNRKISTKPHSFYFTRSSHDVILNSLNAQEPPTIIIPVYNAHRELSICLDSIIRNTLTPSKLLIIDDASTEPEISELIQSYDKFSNVRSIKNDKNLGYTKTINRGISECKGDVVLLNSDTEVGPGWLNRLRIAAYIDPEIATATALSNNAGAFSVPIINVCNALPASVSRDDLARSIAANSQRIYPATPTGNGFCMFIKRKVIDEIGSFDEKRFPRGYGEENDFCMRAKSKGWRHVIDDSTIVYHHRTASFGEEKSQLVKEGTFAIHAKYPKYRSLVRSFINAPEMHDLRDRISEIFSNAELLNQSCKRRILYILHESSGGTPATSRDLACCLESNSSVFFLTSDTKTLRLYFFVDGERVLIREWTLNSKWRLTDFTRQDYRKIIFEILLGHNIELVHIRHLLSHTFDAPDIAASLNIPVILSFHDFYFTCPTINLLDDNNIFCGGKCTPGHGVCSVPFDSSSSLPQLKHAWIKVWQNKASRLFGNIDAFVTTSKASKNIILKSYPFLEKHHFPVIEHGRDLKQQNNSATAPSSSEVIRILIPGHLDIHKGGDFIKKLIDCDSSDRLEFWFLGRTTKDFQKLGKCLGEYEREDFGGLVAKIRPAFIGIFSITCETYCHTLTEAWATGIPVLVSNIGTQKDRLNKHKGGWLVDMESPRNAYNQILQIAEDLNEYNTQKSMANLKGIRSVREMAADYDHLYKDVISRRKPFSQSKIQDRNIGQVLRIGLFAPAGPKWFNASTYVRILNRLTHSRIRHRVSFQIIDVDRFLLDPKTSEFDLALIQRNAIAPGNTEKVVQLCKDMKRPIVFEIDDNLLDLPPNSKVRADYIDYLADLEVLASSASAITVSTPQLAKVLKNYSSNIRVFPNFIDESLWKITDNHPNDKNIGNSSVSAVYIGTKTHAEDLKIIRRPMKKLQLESEGTFKFYVIGGEENSESTDWYSSIRIPDGCKAYPKFIGWLQNLELQFDFAVAPLAENSLNGCKSHLKYLEYSALGLPGIYSDFGPYPEVINHGVNGFLSKNTEADWYEKIDQMATNIKLRNNTKKTAYEDIQRNHLLNQHIDEYADFLFDICLH